MAIQSTLTIAQQNVGSGDSDAPSDQRVNANAPPKGSVTVTGSGITVTAPTGFTVTGCYLRPPYNSTNAKIVKGNSGDATGLPGWTNQPLNIPVNGAGSSFYIANPGAGTEVVELLWN